MLVMLGGFLTSGCTSFERSPAQVLDDMPTAGSGEGCVVIFRYDEHEGLLPRYPHIAVNGERKAPLRAGSFVILRLPPGEIKIEAVGPFYRWPYTSYSTTRELSAGETLVLRLATRNKAIESADDDVPDEEQIKSYRTVTYFSEYSPWNPYVLAELRELSVVSL